MTRPRRTPGAARAREEALCEQIDMLRAEIRTLKSYLADRDEQLRRYEVGAEWEKSRASAQDNAPPIEETDHVQR
jgi:hypothetical protein